MRFASHRDVARAVERGVRRSRLPIAFSAGFTPHPKISYAGAAPTGTASEAEYLELSLTQRCTASEVRERLDAALPDGVDVIEVTEAAPSLAALPLEASHWQVVLPGVPPSEAARAVEVFLACDSVEVERLTAKGTRRMDARAPVVTAAALVGDTELTGEGAGNAMLRMVVRHVTPAVRPDDILAALRSVAGLAPSLPPVVTRLAQGALDEVMSAADQGKRLSEPPEVGSGAASAPNVPDEQVKTTHHAERTAGQAGPPSAGACNQLPRGADDPLRAAAPGSLTGDSPDARQRAERHRIRQ